MKPNLNVLTLAVASSKDHPGLQIIILRSTGFADLATQFLYMRSHHLISHFITLHTECAQLKLHVDLIY